MPSAKQEPRVESARLRAALAKPRSRAKLEYLSRIPVRSRKTLVLVPTSRVTMILADGENVNISTLDGETHSINYRLKNLATRLDPAEFVRLSRGALANVNAVSRIVAGPSGTSRVIFDNGLEVAMSRMQSRRLREIVHGLLS